MKNPTNQDLHIMLARIEEQITFVSEKIDDIKISQKEHEKKDDERFSNLNHYAASIAIVASFMGAGIMWAKDKLMGKL